MVEAGLFGTGVVIGVFVGVFIGLRMALGYVLGQNPRRPETKVLRLFWQLGQDPYTRVRAKTTARESGIGDLLALSRAGGHPCTFS